VGRAGRQREVVIMMAAKAGVVMALALAAVLGWRQRNLAGSQAALLSWWLAVREQPC